jgi:hypothetical protein
VRDSTNLIVPPSSKFMNPLHPTANPELGEVFDECPNHWQWIAIMTGAGDRARFAFNDLKATAAGIVLP